MLNQKKCKYEDDVSVIPPFVSTSETLTASSSASEVKPSSACTSSLASMLPQFNISSSTITFNFK